jgi:hypothetical protein
MNLDGAEIIAAIAVSGLIITSISFHIIRTLIGLDSFTSSFIIILFTFVMGLGAGLTILAVLLTMEAMII